MKCPKCAYLGFETGDRCKNCGYDFSFAQPRVASPDPDLAIRTDDAETGSTGAPPELWLDRLDRSMDEASKPQILQEHLVGVPEVRPAAADPGSPSLPLFNPDDPDDIPLIALPAAPRPPLAVRRTPDTPRLRAVPKATRMPAPALDFHEEPAESGSTEELDAAVSTPAERDSGLDHADRVGGRRLAALLVDHAILAAIDVAVLYFTLRMTGLGMAEAQALPILPMVLFLGLLKLSYFTAFTAIGGQTIGKMAFGIQVIADDGDIEGARAIKRTVAGVLSVLTFGVGFLPAFFGADRRTLHDRLTGTRVVGLPSD